jgi:hypothetical protein
VSGTDASKTTSQNDMSGARRTFTVIARSCGPTTIRPASKQTDLILSRVSDNWPTRPALLKFGGDVASGGVEPGVCGHLCEACVDVRV